jgi:hypothetical protein
MTFHIQTQDMSLEGVTHRWSPRSSACPAYGTLQFGPTGRSVIVFLSTPAEIDEVFAELVALRAEMTGEPEPEPLAASGPPRHVTGAIGDHSCAAKDRGYICNAQAGHDGPEHVAYGTEGQECYRWPVTVAERARRGAAKSGFEPVASVTA